MKQKYNCIVMGAAGRDFHIFLSFLRNNEHFRVKAFTATQIPFIGERDFPQSLAGSEYDEDIPIHDESEMAGLIKSLEVDFVFFAYSDISHQELMHKASLVQAAGASFVMLCPEHTQLKAEVPVVSITATRTGAGKSPLTQWLARSLIDRGNGWPSSAIPCHTAISTYSGYNVLPCRKTLTSMIAQLRNAKNTNPT